MQYIGKFRKATSSEWAKTNPILPSGVVGIDITVQKHKIGNGITKWKDLPFVTGSSGSGDTSFKTLGTYITSNGKFGYPEGTKGSVVQALSRTSPVELNALCGQIELFASSSSAGSVDSFILTNNKISSSDIIITNISSGATENCYAVTVTEVLNGSCRIQIQNLGSSAGIESPIISFAIFRA